MSDLVPLLRQALYIYRREPEVLHILLQEPMWIESEEMLDAEVHGRIRKGDSKKRTELMVKTLIDAESTSVPRPLRRTSTKLSIEHFKRALGRKNISALDEAQAGLRRKKMSEDQQATRSTEDYLITHFLDRVEKLGQAVDLLDSYVGKRVPQELRRTVRDCQIGLADENYIAAAVLMGASVEWALRDLLNENVSGLGALIARAKQQDLIKRSEDEKRLQLVKSLRDRAIHYGQADADDVEEGFVVFRDLLVFLYRDREENY